IGSPALGRARVSASESSGLAALRSFRNAQLQYSQLYATVGFADNFTTLGPPPPGQAPSSSQANLLDFVLGCSNQPCLKSGYLFAVDQTSGTPINAFRVTAVPQTPGRTGQRGFCSTEPRVITADPAGGTACSV